MRQSDASAGTPSFESHAIYMGPWDIMSQHFVKRTEPPPGISSFTKIRLGWITANQVQTVRPGETKLAFLVPLATKGDTLVLRVPLKDGAHYLIENRQPVGNDRALPESGILILKVYPDAREGYGTVELVNADPSASGFARASFRLDAGRNLYTDKVNGVAILPLWKEEGGRTGVLVTTPDKAPEALRAARVIDGLMRQPSAGRGDKVREAISAFKQLEFTKSNRILHGSDR